jgi:hypothetical protein
VELPGVRAGGRRRDRALRRKPRGPDLGALWRTRRGDRGDLFRHQRALPAGLRQTGASSQRSWRTSPGCAASGPPARRCRPRGSAGSTTTSPPRCC